MKTLARWIVLCALSLTACASAATPVPTPAASPALPSATPRPTLVPSPTPRGAPTRMQAPGTPVIGEGGITGELPAPLYFLSSAEPAQVWRIARDGQTLTQVTHTEKEVVAYDVTRVDGRIAYVTDNQLYVAGPLGEEPRMLVNGPDPAAIPPDQGVNYLITAPLWAPDAKQLAFGLGGVNLLDPNGDGTFSTLVASDPMPEPGANQGANFYAPSAWAPNGTALLLNVSYLEGGGLSVVSVPEGVLVELRIDNGVVCCYDAWSRDSGTVYVANDTYGMVASGLWAIDAQTGVGRTLVRGEGEAGTFNLFAAPFEGPNKTLYYFFLNVSDYPQGTEALLMHRSALDGVTVREALRVDGQPMIDALWAPDASFAIAVAQDTNELVFVPADGAALAKLPGVGTRLRWGK